MKKERLKVLEMVEEGKISVDEATKLLETLKAGADFEWGAADYDDAEERLNQFSKNVDAFAKDFSDKFSSAFKEVEPKLKSATKVVIEKTVSMIDEVSRSLHEAATNMETVEKPETEPEPEPADEPVEN